MSNTPNRVRAAFEMHGLEVPIEKVLPIRQISPTDYSFGKYAAVLASTQEVGVIEPLVVNRQRGGGGNFTLLDGHLRLKALQELKRTSAFCLVSTDDDAFTYNDKVNRLSTIQEHAMLTRALEHGVTAEQIAKALAVDVRKIRSGVNLLDGIHKDAVEILKDKHITAAALRIFKKVRPVRQIDMAQLMVSASNYTRAYAMALLIGTPTDQLVAGERAKKVKGLSEEDARRIEKEMDSGAREFRLVEEKFGENALHLNAAQRYVKRLLENARVRRFLEQRYPEVLEELQEVATLESI